MTIAFYGFQQAPDVRIVTPDTGWGGWFEARARPLIERGYPHQHLHNPFGLYPIRDRAMHIDQFELASCQGLAWLANADAFAAAVRRVHRQGGTVRAYVGSPLAIPEHPRSSDWPRCMPGARRVSAWLGLLSRLGLCSGLRLPAPFSGWRLGPACLCWRKLVSFYIAPLVAAQVDAIGFDASRDFDAAGCMDRLVRRLMAAGIEVMIEPWPRNDRRYPPVSWIIRERLYHRIRLDPRPEDASPETIAGRLYRIVPADDSEDGRSEIDDINALRASHGEARFANTQEIVDSVRNDGHVPLVRSRQLSSGSVT